MISRVSRHRISHGTMRVIFSRGICSLPSWDSLERLKSAVCEWFYKNRDICRLSDRGTHFHWSISSFPQNYHFRDRVTPSLSSRWKNTTTERLLDICFILFHVHLFSRYTIMSVKYTVRFNTLQECMESTMKIEKYGISIIVLRVFFSALAASVHTSLRYLCRHHWYHPLRNRIFARESPVLSYPLRLIYIFRDVYYFQRYVLPLLDRSYRSSRWACERDHFSCHRAISLTRVLYRRVYHFFDIFARIEYSYISLGAQSIFERKRALMSDQKMFRAEISPRYAVSYRASCDSVWKNKNRFTFCGIFLSTQYRNAHIHDGGNWF